MFSGAWILQSGTRRKVNVCVVWAVGVGWWWGGLHTSIIHVRTSHYKRNTSDRQSSICKSNPFPRLSSVYVKLNVTPPHTHTPHLFHVDFMSRRRSVLKFPDPIYSRHTSSLHSASGVSKRALKDLRKDAVRTRTHRCHAKGMKACSSFSVKLLPALAVQLFKVFFKKNYSPQEEKANTYATSVVISLCNDAKT